MSQLETAPPREAVPLLETRGLAKSFGGLRAVDGVDLVVRPGHIHGVIGPNGAGKTTLFNLITGECRPSAGHVYFRGRDITGLPPYAVTALGIARKFQLTQIFATLTVGENIQLAVQRQSAGSMLGLLRSRDYGGQIEKGLEPMHLEDKCDVVSGSLGHGERQRLELAMVLATGADLLLLDEPTSGMSLEEREEIGTFLRGIVNQTTVLIVEHDFPFIKQVADIVTVLDKGAKIAEGSVSEVERDARVRECYLGAEGDA